MTRASRGTGLRGEQIAQDVLRRKGFRIEALNWRHGRMGEIDIVARHPSEDLLVFVEVKTRKGASFGTPAEAVDTRKQAQIAVLAEVYLSQTASAPKSVRFDVIGICFPGGSLPAEIQHIENAF